MASWSARCRAATGCSRSAATRRRGGVSRHAMESGQRVRARSSSDLGSPSRSSSPTGWSSTARCLRSRPGCVRTSAGSMQSDHIRASDNARPMRATSGATPARRGVPLLAALAVRHLDGERELPATRAHASPRRVTSSALFISASWCRPTGGALPAALCSQERRSRTSNHCPPRVRGDHLDSPWPLRSTSIGQQHQRLSCACHALSHRYPESLNHPLFPSAYAT